MSMATATKAKAFIMKDWQIKAALQGRLSLLIVPMKPQPPEGWRPERMCEIHKMVDGEFPLRRGEPIVKGWGAVDESGEWGYCCPFGPAGREIYGKEAWCGGTGSSGQPAPGYVSYRADGEMIEFYRKKGFRWRPAVSMPAEFSRFHYVVAGVAVRRVDEVTETEAISAGFQSHYCSPEDTASCKPGSIERALAKRFEGGYLTAKFHACRELGSETWCWFISLRAPSGEGDRASV